MRYYKISEDAAAAKAGCHRITVSKFFKPDHAMRMAPLKRHRIKAAIECLLSAEGYTDDLSQAWMQLDAELALAVEAAA